MSFRNKLESLGISLKRSSGSVKTICPKCSPERRNKRDLCLSVNIDTGVYNCHHCGWKGGVKEYAPKKEYKKLSREEYLKDAKITDSKKYLNERGLSDETISHFMIYEKVQQFPDKQTGQWVNKKCISFPYFRDADLVNVQYRSRDKDFRLEKDAELIFYNINSLNGVKRCIITEGQIDCMSAYECGFGNSRNKEQLNKLIDEKISLKKTEMLEDNEFNRKQKKTGYSAEELKNVTDDEITFTDEMNILSYLSGWGVVSVPNGASTNLDFLDNCADYFFGIEEIIIATDGDVKGIEMRDALILRFGAERCKYVDYNRVGEKDFNDVLVKKGKDAVIELVRNAVGVHVDGIHFVDDMIDDMWTSYHTKARMGTTTGMTELDELFVWKLGEVNCWYGYANQGKTTFLNFLMVCKVFLEGWKFAIFSPENYPSTDFYNSLIEVYIGKQIHPKNENYKMTEAEYLKGINFIKDNFFFVYPENEHDLDSVHEKFKYLILKKGVNAVVVDPFNQLDKTGSVFQRDDQYLSVVFAKVKRFALSYQISYNIVAHPNKPQNIERGKPLPIPTYYDLNGGALWANKMDNMYCFYKEEVNKPEFKLIVGKNKKRATGGGLLGDFRDGIYRWEDNRFYFQDKNPLSDADGLLRSTYGQQTLDQIFDKPDDLDYLTSDTDNPPF